MADVAQDDERMTNASEHNDRFPKNGLKRQGFLSRRFLICVYAGKAIVVKFGGHAMENGLCR